MFKPPECILCEHLLTRFLVEEDRSSFLHLRDNFSNANFGDTNQQFCFYKGVISEIYHFLK